jgi:hypothetical protein
VVLGEEWDLNPALTVGEEWFDLLRLWRVCRGGMSGTTLLPDAGGVNDQAAWLIDAFGRLSGLDAEADEAEREARGAGR